MTVDELLKGIEDDSPSVRTKAWQAAPEAGPDAIAPLAAIAGNDEADLEVHRAAERALWAITRDAGRPDAGATRRAVATALANLLSTVRSETVRRHVIWMLSEIGTEDTAEVIAPFLKHRGLREDARCVLTRLPGEAATEAMKAALESADDEFKASLAQGLRARGAEVDGIPCVKLVPTRETEVEV